MVAHENLSKPNVRAAIDQRLEKALSAAGVTVEQVLNDIEMARQLAIRDGKWSAALRASELQGKFLGMFSGRIDPVQAIEGVSTEDLVERLGKIVRRGDVKLNRLLEDALRPDDDRP